MSEQRMIALTEPQIEAIKSALQLTYDSTVDAIGRLDPSDEGTLAYAIESRDRFTDAFRAMSVELIQRLPTPGDRWRGLDDQELLDIVSALVTFANVVHDEQKGTYQDRHRVRALGLDASQEMERRQPGYKAEIGRHRRLREGRR